MNTPQNNFSYKKFIKEIVKNKIDAFNDLVSWDDEEKAEFKILLDELKKPYDKNKNTTKDKGDRLENLVSFILSKSYFYEVYRNVCTETNEIDEVVVFTKEGRQALKELDLSRDLIPIDTDMFLGECKNYNNTLGVTYVGKFYSLLTATDNSFGIIFTQKGLTGEAAGYKDAYGLVKVIRMIEQNKNNKDFYIITFTIEDYEELLNGKNFFELVEAKKKELKLAANYHTFLKDNKHENEEQIKEIISKVTG